MDDIPINKSYKYEKSHLYGKIRQLKKSVSDFQQSFAIWDCFY